MTATTPDCSFKSLCLDADDARALSDFWARLLSWDCVVAGEGWHLAPLSGDHEGLWIDPVPEPRRVKTRVHLDLRLPTHDVHQLVTAGAIVVSEPGEGQRWWVLADPEGNLFCAMPPAPPEFRLPEVDVPTPFELVVDATDPQQQAQWWAERTGGQARTRAGASFWWIEHAAGFPWLFWVFTSVPEAKVVKNRLHWDVRLTGSNPVALIDAGATLLREPDDDVAWWVLADPEGNEFCAFAPDGHDI
jgi:hypothetical protein